MSPQKLLSALAGAGLVALCAAASPPNLTVSVLLDYDAKARCKITPGLYADFASSPHFDRLVEANPDAELALGNLDALAECGPLQIASLHRAVSRAGAVHLASLSFSHALPSATRHVCGATRPFAEGINIYFISLDGRSEEAALSLLSLFMEDPATFC